MPQLRPVRPHKENGNTTIINAMAIYRLFLFRSRTRNHIHDDGLGTKRRRDEKKNKQSLERREQKFHASA